MDACTSDCVWTWFYALMIAKPIAANHSSTRTLFVDGFVYGLVIVINLFEVRIITVYTQVKKAGLMFNYKYYVMTS